MATDIRRTVAAVISWHLKNDVRLKSPAARRERARVLALFERFCTSDGRIIGTSYTDECCAADVMEFLAAQPPHAAWTVWRYVSTIKRPFNNAARLGLIPGNPFSGASSPRGRCGRDLTPAEFSCLLRNATPPFRRVLVFLRFSGARPGELRKLEWAQVRDLARTIVQGEHKSANTLAAYHPRRIQLNSVLVKLLAWLKRKRQHPTLVFVNSYRRQWQTRRLCANLQKIRERCKLPDDVKLYGCRHSYATGAIVNGVDIKTLAELMGHASITTTERYTHLADQTEHLRNAAEKAIKSRAPRSNGPERQGS